MKTKPAPYIPSPEGRGFTAHLVNGGNLTDYYRERKLMNMELGEIYRCLGWEDKAVRIWERGTHLSFRRYLDGTATLESGNFCDIPLCPMCAAMRSRKNFVQLSRVMDAVPTGYKFLFLTLTMKNVPGWQLRAALKQILKAFHALRHRKDFKAVVTGWFRTLEITRNWSRDTYHPHIHVVLMVPATYAEKGKEYLSFEWWRDTWQECLGVDYKPMVNIERVRPRMYMARKDSVGKDSAGRDSVGKDSAGKEVSFSTAVREVTKYVAKTNDYMADKRLKNSFQRSCEAVEVLDDALRRLRRVAYGGLMKKLHKELNLDGPEKGSSSDDVEVREDLAYIIIAYRWCGNLLDYKKIYSEYVGESMEYTEKAGEGESEE